VDIAEDFQRYSKASWFDASPWHGDAPAGVRVADFGLLRELQLFHTTEFEHAITKYLRRGLQAQNCRDVLIFWPWSTCK